jgi:hypothetical protein
MQFSPSPIISSVFGPSILLGTLFIVYIIHTEITAKII